MTGIGNEIIWKISRNEMYTFNKLNKTKKY